ncbi:MAG: D-2-hydroxyacid dehydrogenase family protein [Lautropia sp.]
MTGVRIAIIDDFQDAVRTLPCFATLAGRDVTVFHDHLTDEDALATRLRDFDALVPIRERTQLTGSLLARLPRLALISLTGPDSGQIDRAACERLGIAIREGGESGASTPELAWALILAASRRIPQEDRRVRAGAWQGSLGRVLKDRTLGILGYGRLGARMVPAARAFGMRVIAWGGPESRQRAGAAGVEIAADRAALFAESDVLTVHQKLGERSRGNITAADFARMKPDALFVNTSRAALVVPGALQAALRAGRPGMAALDVFEEEPVVGPIDGPPGLQTMDQVVLTPHLGYVTREGYQGLFGPAFSRLVEAIDAGLAPRGAR